VTPGSRLSRAKSGLGRDTHPLSILLGFLVLLLVIGAMMTTFLGSVENVLLLLAPRS
jgi:hypothetical protein